LFCVYGHRFLCVFEKQQVRVSGNKHNLPVYHSKYFDTGTRDTQGMDFTKAVSVAIPAVAHIKTKIPAQDIRTCSAVANDFLSQLLGLELRAGYMPE